MNDEDRQRIFDAKIEVLISYKRLERALSDGGCADEALKVDKRATAMSLQLNGHYGHHAVIEAQAKYRGIPDA